MVVFGNERWHGMHVLVEIIVIYVVGLGCLHFNLFSEGSYGCFKQITWHCR